MAPFIAAAAFAAACAPASGPSVRGDAGPGGGDAAACVGDAPVNLTGTWAARAILVADLHGTPAATIKLCPDPQEQAAVLTLLVEIEHADGDVAATQRLRLCRLDLPPVRGNIMCPRDPSMAPSIRIRPGPALETYLETSLVIDGAAALSEARVCATYRPDPFVLLLGARLADAARDPLPDWIDGCSGGACADGEPDRERCVANAADVADTDGDGRPGVTVLADSDPPYLVGGEAYVTLRTAPALSGVIEGPARIAGGARATLAYGVLGSGVVLSESLCIESLQLRQTLPRFEILPEKSTFTLLRVDGREGAASIDDDGNGNVTCEEVNGHDELWLR